MACSTQSSALQLETLPDPGDRYTLGPCLGSGVFANVFEANDNQEAGKLVAVKIQTVAQDNMQDLAEEYRVLRDLSSHPNLPDFYGVYIKKEATKGAGDQLWFVMELCGGGTAIDLVRGLQEKNKRMHEEHIAYLMKGTLKAMIHLHEGHVMHRDIKGSNILLTKDGEVKLVDFGLSRHMMDTMDKRGTCVGSPCWMAPEVVASLQKEAEYDNRADVWALGVTGIELGDGRAPFQDMHPTRALFQIVRNPPPTLYRPANWTNIYNDFINECLEKNPEHRPFMLELMEHPFITAVPENDYILSQELKSIVEGLRGGCEVTRRTEQVVRQGYLKTGLDSIPELMHTEDLAALETLTEDSILQELQERHMEGHHQTFLGDVLLVLNPNQQPNIYGNEFDAKYRFKSRSDNEPHVFAVADRAYQDALHHEESQHIVIAGESGSGKTTNIRHILDHLIYLGQSDNNVGGKVQKAWSIVQTMCNAATPVNPDSTRHVLQLEVTFTGTGKLSGAILWLYQLEKWRVTSADSQHANFHVFYYFYDAMAANGCLKKYSLDGGRKYRYLRADNQGSKGPRENARANIDNFQEFKKHLSDLEFTDKQQDTLWSLLAAILIVGEVAFKDNDEGQADIENVDVAARVAKLLGVDEKKFCWALINYCVVEKGTAVRRRHSKREAEEAADVLARGLYHRVVDWVINVINLKLSLTRAVFGDKCSVSLVDLFGFECFKKNNLEQLFVNTLNEQLQYHYTQRIFVWEMQEQEQEEIPLQKLQFYDNRPTVDELLLKPTGLLYLLDESSRKKGPNALIELLESGQNGPRLKAVSGCEFSVAHYTGKVTYDATHMAEKNSDFLPPEMIEILRLSTDTFVVKLFSNQLSKTGNLTLASEELKTSDNKKGRWGTALIVENESRARRLNTESQGEFSQSRAMRTAASTFRATCLEILRRLSAGGGTHFVRCLRTDLTGRPQGFQKEVVRQQLRALAVLDTARARQKGFPHRVSFAEFIRRYKFLAFDFDESVEVSKENSRLLLVRLKMEGWLIGTSKVFLTYYNVEFLSRLYEIKVKKIIKVQTMMRSFLAKRNIRTKLYKLRQDSGKRDSLIPA